MLSWHHAVIQVDQLFKLVLLRANPSNRGALVHSVEGLRAWAIGELRLLVQLWRAVERAVKRAWFSTGAHVACFDWLADVLEWRTLYIELWIIWRVSSWHD